MAYYQPPKREIPKKCIYKHTKEVVEVRSRGHFPDTVVIKLGDGREIECYEFELLPYTGESATG